MPSLPDIYEAYRSDARFDHLRTEHIVLVPGEGSSRPSVLIVGEAPGAMENTHRRPFVGASGAVLRSLIKDTAGLPEHAYFITNTVKYRLPGNRIPTPAEVDSSLPYLRQEYAALGAPAAIVAVGGVAVQAFWKHKALSGVGRPVTLPNGTALWPMISPELGMQRAEYRPQMEQHWTALGDWLREEGLA